MSAQTSTAHPGHRPFWRRPGFWRKNLPVASLVVAALTALAIFASLRNTSGPPSRETGVIPKPAPLPKTVRLDPSVHSLISRFVHSVVAGKNLAVSYRMIGPTLREGLTLKQWTAGNVTVVPYPVDAKTTLAYEKPDYSYATKARVQVHIVTPDEPKLTRKQETNTFYVTLIKRDGRWLIDDWVPRWTAPIPTAG